MKKSFAGPSPSLPFSVLMIAPSGLVSGEADRLSSGVWAQLFAAEQRNHRTMVALGGYFA